MILSNILFKGVCYLCLIAATRHFEPPLNLLLNSIFVYFAVLHDHHEVLIKLGQGRDVWMHSVVYRFSVPDINAYQAANRALRRQNQSAMHRRFWPTLLRSRAQSGPFPELRNGSAVRDSPLSAAPDLS